MTSISPQARASDARGADRTSLYLAANVYCDGSSVPIRIRNMSASGALLEGAVVPAEGALVQLIRGGLIVHALVRWAGDGRCGLKFSGRVDVQQWKAVPTNCEQQRVDEVVRLVKAGAVPLPVPRLEQPSSRHEGAVTAGELSGDLRRVSDLLEELGGVLAGDSNVVGRHGPALQNLDIAIQVIAVLESIIMGQRDSSSDAEKLTALRTSADQALQRRS